MKKLYILLLLPVIVFAQKIDRKKVVERHIVKVNAADTLAALSVGNGKFAFTVDVTGLQSFPQHYQKGIPLGTQSEWGWHAFENKENYRIEETIRHVASHGRKVPYAVQWKEGRPKEAGDFLRQNPHRLQLGNVGLEILNKEGIAASPNEISNVHQELNPWTGIITSYFELEGKSLTVETLCSQQADRIGVSMKGSLLAEGRVRLKIKFPYPSYAFLDEGTYYPPSVAAPIQVVWQQDRASARIIRTLDRYRYKVSLDSECKLTEAKQTWDELVCRPDTEQAEWKFAFEFAETDTKPSAAGFDKIRNESAGHWKAFWEKGGMIDFEGTEDPRAIELERRMILSLYLTRIQCGGQMPPQETGLTMNSWFGKPHLEMAWWHGVHFALWGREEFLENYLEWYLKNRIEAGKIAKRQGFKGVRWQKMTDPDGKEGPSSVGAYLIWQQPHPVYFAELIYRIKPSAAVLKKYRRMVYETADFMASYAWFDPEKQRYILGKGIIAAQERFDPDETFNPTYELAYWKYALETAQQWRLREKQNRNPEWDKVLGLLSPLPVQDGLYLAAESAPDSYTRAEYMTDHPSVLGAFGMLPAVKGLDTRIMRSTFDKVWRDWHWEDTWGWDFPMVAMTATRLTDPEKAVEGLMMPIRTNTFLINGHNYQDKRLRLYLPGNGGLLAALAMMTAGFDGSGNLPGIPDHWKVRYEGLYKMP